MSEPFAAPARGWAGPDKWIDAGTTVAAALGVLFVTAAGLVLSYNALWELARLSGAIAPGLAWLWPLTLDALAIVASLNVLWAETRQERDRYAWGLVIAFTLLSVLFNAIHASLTELLALNPLAPALVAGFVGILPPIAAAFALHLLVRLLRRVLERVQVIAGLGQLVAQRRQLLAELAQRRQEAAVTAAELAGQVDSLAARREALQAEIGALKLERAGLRQAKTTANDGAAAGFVPGDLAALARANLVRQTAVALRREQVQALWRQGLSQVEIAARLQASESTIRRDIHALAGSPVTVAANGQPRVNGTGEARQ